MITATPSPAELVVGLRGPSPRYKRAEMDRVLEHLDECEQELLSVLREAVDDVVGFGEREGPSSFALLYALHLLARHRSEAAHELLLALLREPEETVDRLLGDAVTEDLGTWLYATAGGSPQGIERLASDRTVWEWVRSAAVDARAMLGDSDPALRDETVVFLQALLMDDEEPDGGEAPTAAAKALLDLGHGESADLLREAIQQERLDPWAMDASDIDIALSEAGQAGEYVGGRLARYLPEDDPHKALSWWAAFEENRDDSSPWLAPSPGQDRKAVVKKAGVKKKSRNKAEKKARRKQRKRR